MRRYLRAIKRRLTRVAAPHHPDREAIVAEFDAAYYLAVNRDVAHAKVDPVDHFLRDGWREGRDPSRTFSLHDYVEAYPDIGAAGVNPFVHYVTVGRREGRKARLDLGHRVTTISRLSSIETRIAERTKAAVPMRGRADLKKALGSSRGGARGPHLTFSHDDYTANVGGLQLCIQREAAAVKSRGGDHLHIFPAQAWPVMRRAQTPGRLGVVWNDRFIGVFTPEDIAAAAPALARRGGTFAIHSLLGQTAGETIAIVRAAGMSAGHLWLHDFSSLCAGVHLLRNDVADCAAPPPDSPACTICVYRPWRDLHLDEHERLFAELTLTVVSPSQATLDTWRAGWDFQPAAQVVHPHATLLPRPGVAPCANTGPLRVVFVGSPAAHKGWPVFRDLMLKHQNDPRYSFHHLGNAAADALPIDFRPVSASQADTGAMWRALEALAADVALIWPTCRETFSFTAYEAAASGAVVITNPDSGNVAAFVAQTGLGEVLADDAALAAAFESGDMLRFSRAARPRPWFDLEYGALTLDLLDADDDIRGAA